MVSGRVPSVLDALRGSDIRSSTPPDVLFAASFPAGGVAALIESFPPGTSLRVVDGASIVSLGRQATKPTRLVAQPSGLQALGAWRNTNGRGRPLLILRDSPAPDEEDLRALQAGLASDSVCASISLDEAARAELPPGIPPPVVERPGGRATLVSGDALDIVLMLPGAEATPPSTEDVLDVLERALVRPGLVHRAVLPRQASVLRVSTPHKGADPDSTLRVVVDGRCFDHPLSGTQVQIISMVGALSRRTDIDVVVLGEGLHETVAPVANELCPAVPILSESNLPWKADVFHRPYQIFHAHELSQCLGLADRFVLTQQDMIMARTPVYHRSREDWQRYIKANDAALAVVDQVGFFSLHAAGDTLSDGQLDPARATVVPLAAGYQAVGASGPLGGVVTGRAERRPMLLLLGASFWHKNRDWAVRLFLRLAKRGWDGRLVLAGGHPEFGSSAPAEREILAASPEFADRVFDLGHIDEGQKTALYSEAALVLYPSLYEGFGLIPFEAAALGTACIYFARASMTEFLPAEGRIPSFDLDVAADFVLDILSSTTRQAAIVTAISTAGLGLTWEQTAASYVDVYRKALAQSSRTIDRKVFDEIVWSIANSSAAGRLSKREELLVDVYRRRQGFRRIADASLDLGLGARSAVRSSRRLWQ